MISELMKAAGVRGDRIATFAPIYELRFAQFGIVDPMEQLHYLTQAIHETGYYRWLQEIWGPTAAQKRYERDFRKPWNKNQLAHRLGNAKAGDGRRFLGRGDFQTTGYDNYLDLTKFTGIDFLSNPALLSEPQYAVLSGIRHWTRLSCGRIARGDDRGTTTIFTKKRETDEGEEIEKPLKVNTAVLYITKKVNGGTNGLEERNAIYLKLLAAYDKLQQNQKPTDQPA